MAPQDVAVTDDDNIINSSGTETMDNDNQDSLKSPTTIPTATTMTPTTTVATTSTTATTTTTTTITTDTPSWWDKQVLRRLQLLQLWYPLEWLLAWILGVGFALWYILHNAIGHFLYYRFYVRPNPTKWSHLVPLTTTPQTQQRLAPRVALQELLDELVRQKQEQQSGGKTGGTTSADDSNTALLSFSDEFLIQVMQRSLLARRLASSATIPHFDPKVAKLDMASPLESPAQVALLRQLQRLWPQLLLLLAQQQQDTTTTTTTTTPMAPPAQGLTPKQDFDISLIIPAYRENPISLLITLTTAWKNLSYKCDPMNNEPALEGSGLTPKQNQIQVILVNAGGCGDLTETFSSHYCQRSDKKEEEEEDGNADTDHADKWADFQILDYNQGGGRGGCLNFGAQHATGRILTFLHSDVLLPARWDDYVLQGLPIPTAAAARPQQQRQQRLPNLCAFSFGIDDKNGSARFPPGLQAAIWQGRWRGGNWCRLPYGDSVLSVRATAFDFVGGYPPDQPLLEDYALVQLFRQRAGLFPNTEPIVILPANIACSPRRWQRFNVPYVALANWTFLYRYRTGTTAESLYQMYYGDSNSGGGGGSSSNSNPALPPSSTTATDKLKTQ